MKLPSRKPPPVQTGATPLFWVGFQESLVPIPLDALLPKVPIAKRNPIISFPFLETTGGGRILLTLWKRTQTLNGTAGLYLRKG